MGRAPHCREDRHEWTAEVVALLPALRAFGWSLCHNATEADDLVQETLVKALRHRDSFQVGTNLRAWLFTILRNTYYTTAIRRRREVSDESGLYTASLTDQPAQDWAVALGELKAVLQRMPAAHREALVLVSGAGLTYEEAADICGCAVGTVKSRVNRARKRVIELLGEDDAKAAAERQARRLGARRPSTIAEAGPGAI